MNIPRDPCHKTLRTQNKPRTDEGGLFRLCELYPTPVSFLNAEGAEDAALAPLAAQTRRENSPRRHEEEKEKPQYLNRR